MNTLLASALAETNAQVSRVTSNWYWYVIAGAILLLGGFMAMFKPVVASLTVETMTAMFFIVGGILQAIQLFRSSGAGAFIWSLLLGILFIALGVVLLRNPIAGLFSLTIVVASLVGAFGIVKLVYAFKLRPLSGWVWMLFSGLISLLLAFLIFTNMAASAAITLGVLLAVELISSGVWMLLIGFSFRKVYKELTT
ncbi:MAG TPA: HdeD family acid-resistance protein [Thiolinea sp.]|nr:HdeD family acid-resistance protein [Thiolinea sp.]